MSQLSLLRVKKQGQDAKRASGQSMEHTGWRDLSSDYNQESAEQN